VLHRAVLIEQQRTDGADVGDGVAGLEVQRSQQEVRPFLLVPFWPLQPISGLMTHDMGDFAAHVKLADAIGVVLRAGFVASGVIGC